MKTNNSLALLVGTALLVTLTGCVGYIDGPRVGHVYVEPVVVVEQDDFVYYPRYGMYYGSRSHHYYSREGSRWVPRPEPRGISANVLISSPSVRVDFHDGPAAHHTQVVRTYPKHWTPTGRDKGRKEGQREDRR